MMQEEIPPQFTIDNLHPKTTSSSPDSGEIVSPMLHHAVPGAEVSSTQVDNGGRNMPLISSPNTKLRLQPYRQMRRTQRNQQISQEQSQQGPGQRQREQPAMMMSSHTRSTPFSAPRFLGPQGQLLQPLNQSTGHSHTKNTREGNPILNIQRGDTPFNVIDNIGDASGYSLTNIYKDGEADFPVTGNVGGGGGDFFFMDNYARSSATSRTPHSPILNPSSTTEAHDTTAPS